MLMSLISIQTGTAIYIVGSAFQDAAPFSPAIDGIVLADFMTGDRTTSTIKPIWGMYGLTAGVNHILNVTIGLNPNVTTKSNFELDAILYVVSYLQRLFIDSVYRL